MTTCEPILPNLISSNFLVLIPKRNILTKLQTFLPPEVKTETIEQGSGIQILKHQGDRIRYSKLVLDVILDYNLNNYKQFLEWHSHSVMYSSEDPLQSYCDVILQVMNPLTFDAVTSIRYKRCIPVAIALNSFDISSQETSRFTVNLEVSEIEVEIL